MQDCGAYFNFFILIFFAFLETTMLYISFTLLPSCSFSATVFIPKQMCGATSCRKQHKAARPSVPYHEWHLAVPAVEGADLPYLWQQLSLWKGYRGSYFKIISEPVLSCSQLEVDFTGQMRSQYIPRKKYRILKMQIFFPP